MVVLLDTSRPTHCILTADSFRLLSAGGRPWLYTAVMVGLGRILTALAQPRPLYPRRVPACFEAARTSRYRRDENYCTAIFIEKIFGCLVVSAKRRRAESDLDCIGTRSPVGRFAQCAVEYGCAAVVSLRHPHSDGHGSPHVPRSGRRGS
jgi:hypothetical protein